MTINFGDAQVVTLVADANTPGSLSAYAGTRLVWPAGLALPPLGQLDVLVFESLGGIQIPGYLRHGTNGLEWVMQGALDPIVQALNAIPGTDGWVSDAAKALYQNIGGQLLARGVTLADTRTALTQLYQGAVSNYVAAHP